MGNQNVMCNARIGEGKIHFIAGNPSNKKELIKGIRKLKEGCLEQWMPEEWKFTSKRVKIATLSATGVSFDGEHYPDSLYEIFFLEQKLNVMGFPFPKD